MDGFMPIQFILLELQGKFERTTRKKWDLQINVILLKSVKLGQVKRTGNFNPITQDKEMTYHQSIFWRWSRLVIEIMILCAQLSHFSDINIYGISQ